MAFVYAFLIAGCICALTQCLSSLKVPFPLVAILLMVLGGGLSAAGDVLLTRLQAAVSAQFEEKPGQYRMRIALAQHGFARLILLHPAAG